MNLDKFRNGSRANSVSDHFLSKDLKQNSSPIPVTMCSEMLGAVSNLDLNFMADDPLQSSSFSNSKYKLNAHHHSFHQTTSVHEATFALSGHCKPMKYLSSWLLLSREKEFFVLFLASVRKVFYSFWLGDVRHFRFQTEGSIMTVCVFCKD